jgi:membrane carboxypeptidase/penicillin-binding protein
MDFLNLSIKVLETIGRPANILIKFLIKSASRIKIKGRIRWSYFLGSLFLIGITGGTIWVYKNIISDLPNVNEIYNPPRLSTVILDRNGVLLYKFYESEDRSWISLNKIPQSLIWATLAIEDKDFDKHHGISIKGVSKANEYNF